MRRWIGRLGLALGVLIGLAGCSKGPWIEPFDAPGEWRLSSAAAADVTIADGALRIHVTDPGQIAWTSFPHSYNNFKLTVSATQVSGPSDNEYGVLIRMDGDARFYAFSVSGDGYVRAAIYDESQWTVLGDDWTLNEAVLLGEATNRLEVAAQGATYTFRVNGQEVLQVEDKTLLKGDIGLYAGAFTEGDVVVTFDDLEVAPIQ